MSRRAILVSGLVVAIVAFAVAFAIAAQRKPQAPSAALRSAPPPAASSGALPVLWKVPAFSFPDQNGRPTKTADLHGHVWIADFVFTSCTTICPLITAKMALLQRRLAGRDLRFVSFSVDPDRDSPEVLQKYAEAWRPGESRWLLLSTTKPGLTSLASAMFVAVEPGEKDIGHTNLFFLVDAQGGVRGIYESDRDDALDRLVQDAQALSGAAAGPLSRGPVATGSELYQALGCGACHAKAALAPPLEGLNGRSVKLNDGAELRANAAYLRESIVAPNAKLVAGYSIVMPSYAAGLTPAELDALVEHVKGLGVSSAAKPSASTSPSAKVADADMPSDEPAAAPAPTASTNEPATVVIDPVCSMQVRVTDATPRTTHAGHTVYFCSELCRDRFVAEPARYMKP